jgi:hypothetical protein
MATLELKTKVEGVERVAVNYYDFGDDLTSARELLTSRGVENPDGVLFSHYCANAKVWLRSIIKRCMKKGLNDEETQKIIASATPGIAMDREVDPVSAFRNSFEKKTPEEQAAIRAQLQAILGME